MHRKRDWAASKAAKAGADVGALAVMKERPESSRGAAGWMEGPPARVGFHSGDRFWVFFVFFSIAGD